jgi:hypothetical protein
MDARQRVARRFGSIPVAVKGLSAGLRSPMVKGEGKRNGARLLGSLGLGETIPLFEELAADPKDESAYDFAAGFAEAAGRFPDVEPLKSRFVRAMWPTFRRAFPLESTHEIALGLDEKIAVEGILAPENWNGRNPVMAAMLRHLARRNVRLPPEKLRELLPELKDVDRFSAQARANALHCLALVSPDEAEPKIREELAKPQGPEMISAREELGKALCAARGLVDPHGKIFDRMEKLGFRGISQPEREFIAVMSFHYSMNEHIGDFLELHAAEKWNSLRQAFVDIGAPKSVALLDSWAKLFPKAKPGQKGFDLGAEEARFEKRTGKSLSDELKRLDTDNEGDDIVPLAYIWLAENADKVLEAWKPKQKQKIQSRKR